LGERWYFLESFVIESLKLNKEKIGIVTTNDGDQVEYSADISNYLWEPSSPGVYGVWEERRSNKEHNKTNKRMYVALAMCISQMQHFRKLKVIEQ